MPKRPPVLTSLLASLAWLAACEGTATSAPDAAASAPTVQVQAAGETEPLDGDPDDPAIWIDPSDPARSLLVLTDKAVGLRVHDLDGHVLAEHADGEMNNVDVRDGFVWQGQTRSLVAASNRSDDTVVLYVVDAAARDLVRIGAVPAGVVVYGLCLYRGAGGDVDVIVTSKDGEIVQLRLAESAAGVSAAELRRVQLGSQLEGCVADDALGRLYVGEEDVGVWRLDAEPGPAGSPVAVAAVGDGRLVADVEGLALYRRDDGSGYLLVSSQGDSAYAVYRREGDNAYIGRFRVGPGALDAASETDGIDVTAAPLGPRFPDGLFVVQDEKNEGFTKNFKLVRWGDIAAAFEPPLPR